MIKKQFLLDIDGVLVVDGKASKNSIWFINTLITNEVSFCLLTNSGEMPKSEKFDNLLSLGFSIDYNQLVTASELAKLYLLSNGIKSIQVLSNGKMIKEYSENFTVCNSHEVDAILVGDWYETYNKENHFAAFKALENGARLIAIHENRTWSDGSQRYLDIGFWVKGFEYVSRRKAEVVGKPSSFAYDIAMSRLKSKIDYKNTFFVSDDIHSDLFGAKEIGIKTIHYGPREIPSDIVDYHVSDFMQFNEEFSE